MSDRRKWGAGAIADDIVAQIRAGALAPGQPLPSRRNLAALYVVSETTISRAVAMLGWAGWTVGHQGKEVRVAATPPETPNAPPGPVGHSDGGEQTPD